MPDIAAKRTGNQLVAEAGADDSELTLVGLMDKLDQAGNPVMIIVNTAGATGHQDGVVIIQTPRELLLRGKENVETGSWIKAVAAGR